MKVIKLYGMVLEKFKGIKSLSVDFNGNDTIVEGENGVGKTTLFDAFLWVLFGKDSNNRKDFEIKTVIDKNTGETIHNVDHSVEIKITVNGNDVTLKRIYKEVYKKTRGSLDSVFSGHKTEYELNGIPCNEKEFKVNIDSIIKEEVFRLVTSPNYFNSLKWQDQRKILFELFEKNIMDPLFINESLEPLRHLLEKYSPEEIKKIYILKEKKVKEQIHSIPARIDELKSIVNSSEYEYKYNEMCPTCNQKINNITQEVKADEAPLNIIEIRISELENKLRDHVIEYDEIDKIMYLLGEYNKTKISYLSDIINDSFEMVDFKLFDKLVNGDYSETCEASYIGVSYNKNLNTAAKINVGLDIIKTLSKKYGVSAPIFIDNAESVTKLLDINSQKVLLYVKEGQKTLNVKEVI